MVTTTQIDTSIDANTTQEQEQGIENLQNTTDPTATQPVDPSVIDVSVLEQDQQNIPDAPMSSGDATIAKGLSVAEQLASETQKQRQQQRELDKEIADREADQARAQQRQSVLEGSLRTTADATATRSEVEARALEQSGISGVQKEVDNLNSSIISMTSSIKQAQIQDELDQKRLANQMRGVPVSVVRGRQALLAAERRAERKTEAIELEQLISTSELLQGNVERARQSVQRQVELQFNDLERSLETEKFFLDRVDTEVAGISKDLADKRRQKVEAEQNRIAELKEERGAVFSVAEMASKNGAPSSVIQSINKSENREEALAAAGSYGMSISDRKTQFELNKLKNPTGENIPKRVLEIGNTERTDLIEARTTTEIISRMQTLIQDGLPAAGEERREFRRLHKDIVDRLARERTGAVVSKSEEKTFKKIVGAAGRVKKSKDEIVDALNDLKRPHDENISLIDPTGEVTDYLGSQEDSAEAIVESSVPASTGSNTLDSLLQEINSY